MTAACAGPLGHGIVALEEILALPGDLDPEAFGRRAVLLALVDHPRPIGNVRRCRAGAARGKCTGRAQQLVRASIGCTPSRFVNQAESGTSSKALTFTASRVASKAQSSEKGRKIEVVDSIPDDRRDVVLRRAAHVVLVLLAGRPAARRRDGAQNRCRPRSGSRKAKRRSAAPQAGDPGNAPRSSRSRSGMPERSSRPTFSYHAASKASCALKSGSCRRRGETSRFDPRGRRSRFRSQSRGGWRCPVMIRSRYRGLPRGGAARDRSPRGDRRRRCRRRRLHGTR